MIFVETYSSKMNLPKEKLKILKEDSLNLTLYLKKLFNMNQNYQKLITKSNLMKDKENLMTLKEDKQRK